MVERKMEPEMLMAQNVTVPKAGLEAEQSQLEAA
jgi:hypothetical protein